MSVNMLQKCHGMCNVKMCKYRQDMNCDPHVDEALGGGPERPPLEMPCVSEWIYCQPWIAWLLFLSTQPHWFEDPLKVMHRQSDQLSLFKVRVFIKIDRLTGRYSEATALTFVKKAAFDMQFGTFSSKVINILYNCSSPNTMRAAISICQQGGEESQNNVRQL